MKVLKRLKSILTEDKLKHIVVSAVIATVLSLFSPWWVAAGITLALRDWKRYIPIPRVLKKITPRTEYNKDCFTMVDFI
jgi:hypothetical protein